MKRMLTLLLTLVFCMGLLTACGNKQDEIPTEDVTLWVVTELTDRYGMNDQANKMIRQFQEIYPNVTVKLDILPTDEEERAVYLDKLRTQIMGGGGPDVYLMPTSNVVPVGNPMDPITKNVEPLFRDVKAVMHNGIFYDISEFYDADDDLDKDALNASVMDGGTVDGSRYVIPLRYDFGIYLVDLENFKALGCDVSVFDGGIDDVMRLALESNDNALAYASLPSFPEYYFSETNDYHSGNVLLTEEEVAEFLHLYQAINAMGDQSAIAEFIVSNSSDFIYFDFFFSYWKYGICRTNLSSVLDSLATAKVLNSLIMITGKVAKRQIEMYPMLDTEGNLNCIVQYYAAVGAGTEDPRLAYEFVKLFLSEEAQYESYLSTLYYANSTSSACSGWPVRTVGSVEPRLATLQLQIDHMLNSGNLGPSSVKRAKRFLDENLITEDEVMPLTWEIDEVRFPAIIETSDSIFSYADKLNDAENGYAPTDVDIDALARKYIEDLQLYLDEG